MRLPLLRAQGASRLPFLRSRRWRRGGGTTSTCGRTGAPLSSASRPTFLSTATRTTLFSSHPPGPARACGRCSWPRPWPSCAAPTRPSSRPAPPSHPPPASSQPSSRTSPAGPLCFPFPSQSPPRQSAPFSWRWQSTPTEPALLAPSSTPRSVLGRCFFPPTPEMKTMWSGHPTSAQAIRLPFLSSTWWGTSGLSPSRSPTQSGRGPIPASTRVSSRPC